MAPFVHLDVERDGLGAAWVLRDDDLRAAFIEVGDNVVAIESLVSEQSSELDAVDERSNANGVEAVARHQAEADKVPKPISQGQNLGRHAAFGAAYGLALSPPFAP